MMATMKALAAEYRVSAAKLAMRIAELETAGASHERLRLLKKMLQQTREIQRLLDGYYDLPRSGPFAAVGWKARGRCQDDG